MIERYFEMGIELEWKGATELQRGVGDGSLVDPNDEYVWPMSTLTGNFRFPRNTRIVHDFLPYGAGYTTRKRLGGNDVLSGYFSGCLMTLWQERLSGNWYVGHVGTNQDVDVDNRVKSTFGNSMPQGAMAINAFRVWPNGEFLAIRDQLRGDPSWTPRFLGLVTTGRQFYSILMFEPAGQGPNKRFVVGGKKLVQPMSYEQLRGMLNPMPQRPLPLTPPMSRLGRRLIPG